MNDILEVRHLVKRFGDVTAVDDLSFRVREGELFAFLGVNGAGKSTTIHILCGQLARDGGSVRVCGADPDEAPEQLRRSLGVVFQSSCWSWASCCAAPSASSRAASAAVSTSPAPCCTGRACLFWMSRRRALTRRRAVCCGRSWRACGRRRT